MQAREETRRATVDGLPIAVCDHFLPPTEAARLFFWLSELPFTRNEVARPDTRAFRHWAYNFDLKKSERPPLFDSTVKAVTEMYPAAGPLHCYRAYCNLAVYGDMLFTHTDTLPDVFGLTALWFVAPQWDLEWGGETVFFDKEGDARFIVSPRPGRLVAFDGRIRHAGRPPSRICTIPRLTYAFKLAPETPQQV